MLCSGNAPRPGYNAILSISVSYFASLMISSCLKTNILAREHCKDNRMLEGSAHVRDNVNGYVYRHRDSSLAPLPPGGGRECTSRGGVAVGLLVPWIQRCPWTLFDSCGRFRIDDVTSPWNHEAVVQLLFVRPGDNWGHVEYIKGPIEKRDKHLCNTLQKR